MTKHFSLIAGGMLLLIGTAGFFVQQPEMLNVTFVHAAVYVLAGLIGILLPQFTRSYAKWIGALGVLLATVGFAGVQHLTRHFDLSIFYNYVHGALGIYGLLAYLALPHAGKDTPASPAAPMTGVKRPDA